MRHLTNYLPDCFCRPSCSCRAIATLIDAAVEDLSIDLLVLFERMTPKFYYLDEGDLLVDVTVLLHSDRGSQLSEHDIARLLAGDAAPLLCT